MDNDNTTHQNCSLTTEYKVLRIKDVRIRNKSLLLMKEGYHFKLITDSPVINSNGIITVKELLKPLKYQVEIIKDQEKVILDFEIN